MRIALSRPELKAFGARLREGSRSQRGSVLSAVLIMVAFLGILSGALMTELSTNLLLSTDMVNRVAVEATVSSGADLALSQLQSTPLNAACPTSVKTPTLNGQTANASIANCEAIVDSRSSPRTLTAIASGQQFKVDGAHVQLVGLDDYIVGDSGGNVFEYGYGSAVQRWTLALGGSITATPMVMADPTDPGEFLDVIPASGPACDPATVCAVVRSDDGSSSPPAPKCTLVSTSAFESQPAASRQFPNIAYAGNVAGDLYAIDVTSSGTCDAEDQTPTGDPIVAGPVVFRCQTSCGGKTSDDMVVVTSNGSVSHVLTYSYTSKKGFAIVRSLMLPWPRASGIALDGGALPARVAVSFAGGIVALVQVDASAIPTLSRNVSLSDAFTGGPFWCHCPGGLDLIGVGGDAGHLYVLDTNLATYATYSSGQAIDTTPAADPMGDWYFGANDGLLYEVAKRNGTSMIRVATYGSAAGPIASSPVVGGCLVGLCVYLGSTDRSAYLMTLDARSAVITSCISSAPPTCNGTNPQLWTSVEIGVTGNPQTVHVEGWSYYSP